MEIVYPEKERLLGTLTTPYVHDYLDSCAQLQRYALPVGLGNAFQLSSEGKAQLLAGTADLAAAAASTTSRCSQRQESSFSNRCSPTRTGRVRVLWRVTSFWAALPGGLIAQTASRTDQTKSGRSFRLAY